MTIKPEDQPPVRVLGVSASPRVGGTQSLVEAALEGARAGAAAEATLVSLAGRSIAACDGCERCLAAGRCVVNDDMQPLYGEMLAADVIIVGTPVYFGTPSALCKAFLERVEGFGIAEKRLRLKVGGAIANAACRNGGQEMAMLAIHQWFFINDMLPVGMTSPVAQLGVAGNTDLGEPGHGFDQDLVPASVEERVLTSREVAWLYGRKLATVAAIVRTGREASGLDLPDAPYGQNLPSDMPLGPARLAPESPSSTLTQPWT